jgi:hypothetical protein
MKMALATLYPVILLAGVNGLVGVNVQSHVEVVLNSAIEIV